MDNSTREKIEYEISQIDELVDKSKLLVSLVKVREPDFIEITAIGGILHSFYNGLESIFILIGKTMSFDFTSSHRWHKDLLNSMFKIEAFLSQNIHQPLIEYLGFRHFFRHSYAYTISWDKCSYLFLGLNDFWKTTKRAIQTYISCQ